MNIQQNKGTFVEDGWKIEYVHEEEVWSERHRLLKDDTSSKVIVLETTSDPCDDAYRNKGYFYCLYTSPNLYTTFSRFEFDITKTLITSGVAYFKDLNHAVETLSNLKSLINQ